MRRCAALLAAAILAGCAQPRPFERPAAPVPTGWEEGGGGARSAAELGWREFFTDRQLRSLIEAALEHNRDLRIAVAQVEQARAASGLASAQRLPAIEVQASENRALTPSDLSQTGRARTAARYDLGVGITAYELDFWGRVARLDEAARAQYLAAGHAQRSFRIGLIAEVAASYLSLLELAERESLAAQTVASRGESLKLVRRRREAGLATDLDLLAADASLQAARAQLAELRRQRAQAANVLLLLTGMAGSPSPGRPLAAVELADLTPGLPSEVLLRRPDVMAAEERLIAAHASVEAARAAFFPRIALTASLTTASAALSGLFGAGSGAWLFQPVLRTPLFDGGSTQANIDLAQARRVAAVAEYERAIQQAFREVADALAARRHLAEQLAHQEALAGAQRERLARVEARQRAGLASYLEVLDAERESFAAGQALASARRLALAASVSLYKALGGGADAAP
ncbi:MAG: efflux transporter outer membrane subunit [Rhodocyclaceae bacterium]